MRIALSLIIPLLITLSSVAQKVAIIPKPASMVVGKGAFTLSAATKMVVPNDADLNAATFFNEYLKQQAGFSLDITKTRTANSILVHTRQNIKAAEKDGYTFASSTQGIQIEGETQAGTFYGIQTLIQLLPVKQGASVASLAIPALNIQDAPRFVYRGMHLDVGRHMFPLSFIKKYTDYLALHKLNYFHWHLTEDQGWRIEIKKYPELTSLGGWRNGTIIGHYPGTGNDNQRYGGFYTQQEVKEIVQYAADRFITVVPEIEMPGHSSAAIKAYPMAQLLSRKKHGDKTPSFPCQQK